MIIASSSPWSTGKGPAAAAPSWISTETSTPLPSNGLTIQLKPREQQFLRMYYYEELPKEEIARKLGIKVERLRLIKSRALQQFREIYKKMTKR